MGPRHFSRGKNSRLVYVLLHHNRASMGPRHFSRGKRPSMERFVAASGLASMGPRHFSRGKVALAVPAPCSTRSFNGATAFQPWKV